ncbi:response regulator transcription factor [Luteolibacter arcticus]|uniref:Response regulator transcription factor n=1 Tax=Luteolibacter arcticus TaxID=1581411 RepID=A0ABT3GNA3_9BACT|nr:response regulator transcription factor [Luteolibacter arcticus]MCW1924969.1 response regulator transcription factor [Luteolibacter arcticus]
MIPSKKTVVVVEDDLRLQEHLIKILDKPEDITCLCAVSSAEEALEEVPAYRPDVVLMDINLPGISGIDCIRDLKKRIPHLEVVMRSRHSPRDRARRW